MNEQLANRAALFDDWDEWLGTFQREFRDREDECPYLDDMQDAIQKAWKLAQDENHAWSRDFHGYRGLARLQHFVNKGRRKLGTPIVYRSGLYSGNKSTDYLVLSETEPAYNRLVETSSPPWDLSLILETIETLHKEKRERDGPTAIESGSLEGSGETEA